MKKLFFILAIMFSAVVYGYAQQTTVEGSRLLDNTSISVYGGGLGWINPGVVNEEKFINGVKPSVGIAVDKWLTPVVGAELFYEVSAQSLPFNSDMDRWTVADFMNLGLNAEVNLNNLFHHYTGKPDRIELVPFAGVGWGHGFTKTGGSNLYEMYSGDKTTNFITANLGSEININLGSKRSWQITVRPSIHYMIAGEYLPVQFNSQRAYVALQAGLTYKFGYRNSTGHKTHNFTKAYTVAEYEALQDQYEALKEECDKKPAVVEKVVTVEKEVPVEVVKTAIVTPDPRFIQGSDQIDPTSDGVLDNLAGIMKNNDGEYIITGYASEEGTEEFNQALSLRRANAVRNSLIVRGVEAGRLTAVGGGATHQFGDTYEANRRVTVVKK